MAGFAIHLDESVGPPCTHALVIGVGKYPHLAGGEAPAANPDGMKQLSSPPLSARAFATWLLDEYDNPQKPLGSLALLLSEAAPGPFLNPKSATAHSVEVATIDNIVKAVKEWKRRGDSHDDNRLIFYFCGHGVSQGDDMTLLAADVFADEDNPLNGAFDFRQLMNGLKKCRAAQQVFFVDACRANSDVLIEQFGSFAGQVPLAAGNRPAEFVRRLHIPYYATLDGERSHARRGQVSLFTDALLKSLRGPGSENTGSGWRVITSRLHEAIDHYMKKPQFAGAISGVQVPTVGEMPVFDLHQLPDVPIVPVYVGCLPSEDNAVAEFTCRQPGRADLRRAAAEIDEEDPTREWSLELTFGNYEVEARISAEDVRARSIEARPPFRLIELGKP
ncbi:caspase family protein [Streptomyces sp. ISL-98]|uniref:caspase family protein n=1 Tax=Streptomyces sp. ISL-98 TaxID=2819192 RepID=UPI001BE9B109|nr:caspase family protein [Streptomyces sp. ISL-98]MBT2510546.1 caspase family protein [Streptomyces sp. ISL-98]